MREVLVPQWFLFLGNLLGTSQELAMSDDGGHTIRHASANASTARAATSRCAPPTSASCLPGSILRRPCRPSSRCCGSALGPLRDGPGVALRLSSGTRRNAARVSGCRRRRARTGPDRPRRASWFPRVSPAQGLSSACGRAGGSTARQVRGRAGDAIPRQVCRGPQPVRASCLASGDVPRVRFGAPRICTSRWPC